VRPQLNGGTVGRARVELGMFIFPLLLHILPDSPGQRLLIPLRDARDLDEALRSADDPAGWAAGCRLIDASRRVYTIGYVERAYDFDASPQTLSDAQLRELMSRNCSALGRRAGWFETQARGLSDRPLFDAVVHHAVELPNLRPSVRAMGLVVITVLVVAALVLPALLLLRLLP
jgi:hypothetical protein